MGFFDQNTTYLNGITFPVVEGYCGSVGAAMAAIDGQQNDFAIFESALRADFQEEMNIRLNEGTDVVAIQEASLKGMFEAIINFFKKLGSKIASIFTAFMAKLNSYMMKDTKAFVEKYKKTVGAKGSFKGMKSKYGAPKQSGACPYVFDKNYPAITLAFSQAKGAGSDFERQDFIDSVLSDMVSSTTQKEFAKDLHEALYNDEEVKDDWTAQDISLISTRLMAADKPIAALKVHNDNLQASIKKVIANLQKESTAIAGKFPTDSGKASYDGHSKFQVSNAGSDDKKQYSYNDTDQKNYGGKSGVNLADQQAKVSWMQQEANAHQSAILTYCSAVMNEAKWGLAQDRRIYAQAVAFNPKSVKENALYIEAVGEAAQYEAEAAFEAMEIA